MSRSDKSALQAAELLKAYCGQHPDNCDGCIFRKDFGCGLTRGFGPERWELPTLSRWTKADKMFAAAFKEVGIEAAVRLSDGRLLLKTNSGDSVDMGPLIFIFRGLNMGETIRIEEIVNSEGVLNEHYE